MAQLNFDHIRNRLQDKKLLFIVVFCLLFLPFLNQAFHIDDTGFIEPSRLLGWNPLQVKIGDNEYSYGVPEDRKLSVPLPYSSSHPILLPYILKLLIGLFGENEIPLHLTFLIFPALSLFTIAKLHGLWFPDSTDSKYILLTLFLAMPAFLVNSHTIMSDVPTLSFLLMAILFYARALEKNNTDLYFYVGGVFLTLAIFTTYQMLVFVPLLVLYAILKRKLNIHMIISMLIPVLLLSAWLFMVYKLYNYFPILIGDFSGDGSGIAWELKRGYSTNHLVGKVISIFATSAASLFFIQVIRYSKLDSAKELIRRILIIVVSVFFVFLYLFHYSWGETALLSLYVAMGVVTLRDVVTIGLRNTDTGVRSRNIFLLSWLFVVIGYNIFVLPFGSTRYLLPGLLPMFLLLFDDRKAEFNKKTATPVVTTVMTIAVIFGFMNSFADYKHADAYRKFAGEVEMFSRTSSQPVTVWYIGGWGMNHYMSKAGFKRLSHVSSNLKKGDYLIIPEMPRFSEPAPDLIPRLKNYATREFKSWLPLRVFNGRCRAGFYSTGWGLLPFAFSLKPDEFFEIWKITK